MDRQRLGPELSPDKYQVARDNWTWNDHILRTLTTAGSVSWLRPESICDPACGDGTIAYYADKMRFIKDMYLSDISEPNVQNVRDMFIGRGYTFAVGSCYDNIVQSDVVILTEILEHLDDPDRLLQIAHQSGSKYVVASSPLDERVIGGNHEHVWGWTKNQYRDMLIQNGWSPIAYQELNFYPPAYDFQLWVCKR